VGGSMHRETGRGGQDKSFNELIEVIARLTSLLQSSSGHTAPMQRNSNEYNWIGP
ncbi:hypothetical protein KUCAC02_005402, partial [Chaenocephalus aceratus]